MKKRMTLALAAGALVTGMVPGVASATADDTPFDEVLCAKVEVIAQLKFKVQQRTVLRYAMSPAGGEDVSGAAIALSGPGSAIGDCHNTNN